MLGDATRWSFSKPSLLPYFRRQWQFVEFSAGFTPRRIMPLQDGYESLAVRRLQQMHHFVDDDVFQQIPRFFREFRVEPEMAVTVVAASPLGFHPLQEITGNRHVQL